MVNNITNINKTNNYFSPYFVELKKSTHIQLTYTDGNLETLGFILLNGTRPNEGTIRFGLWCLTPLSTMEK